MELIHCAFLHNSESNAKSHGNISSRWTPLLHAKVLKKTQPLSHHFMHVHTAKSNRAVPGCCQELNTASRHQRSGLPQSGNGNQPHGKDGVLPLLSHRRGKSQSKAKVWETRIESCFIRRCFQRALTEAGVETAPPVPGRGGEWKSSEAKSKEDCRGFVSDICCRKASKITIRNGSLPSHHSLGSTLQVWGSALPRALVATLCKLTKGDFRQL